MFFRVLAVVDVGDVDGNRPESHVKTKPLKKTTTNTRRILVSTPIDARHAPAWFNPDQPR
jgi:hypothetical protein